MINKRRVRKEYIEHYIEPNGDAHSFALAPVTSWVSIPAIHNFTSTEIILATSFSDELFDLAYGGSAVEMA
jgi:hypothetical protein